jgi:hypothetical protein
MQAETAITDSVSVIAGCVAVHINDSHSIADHHVTLCCLLLGFDPESAGYW